MPTTELEAIKRLPIVLGDASSANVSIRAVEPIVAAFFANHWKGPVITNLYPCDSVSRSIQASPYTIKTPGDDSPVQPSSQASRTVRINPTLVAQYYEPFFGDPLDRIANLIRRGEENGKRYAGLAKARKYLLQLPSSLFETAEGIPFVDAVIQDRRDITSFVSGVVYDSNTAALHENALSRLGGVTTRDALSRCKPETRREIYGSVAWSWKCPECSLNATEGHAEGVVTHVIRFDEKMYKSKGVAPSADQAREPRCSPARTFKEFFSDANEGIFSQPVVALIMAGLRPSGKLIYLLESLVYQHTPTVLGVRSYSNSRGTIEMIQREWSGPVILTPRIYIRKPDHPSDRDATAYELQEFIRNGGLSLAVGFVNSLPLLHGGAEHSLTI